ncbi:anaphase-promoting complex subunit 2 [Fopius arisanus]|uniref:Anaphase-promoting complex subunit 2 n=1 Tax=Fopius arisanus TaxID=64838 RepID=A0A0C9R8F9_9HYME|nr:PREDICTED: anaphase-promoting complex subunit 2 [Fopius arisanus]
MSVDGINAEGILRDVRHAFPILEGKVQSQCSDDEYSRILEGIKRANVADRVRAVVIEEIKFHIRQQVAPAFWSKFSGNFDEEQGFEQFRRAVDDLYSRLLEFLPLLKRLEPLGVVNEAQGRFQGQNLNILAQFKLIVRSTLLSQLPVAHDVIIEQFYKIALNVFCNTDSLTVDSGEVAALQCAGCNKEVDSCQCQMIVYMFHETNRKLIELELLERLVGNVLTSLIYVRIRDHVHRVCDRSLDVSQLSSLETWLETVVLSWLTRIFSGGSSKSVSLDSKIKDAIFKFKRKLSYYLYETYTNIRISQLFNIIIEYPDSQPAIEDLRICLERTDLRKALITSLQEALKTRLLHPGVNTPDILTAYIAAIKALRQLDPTGVLLETVTEPIKSYLRSRSDTVRCVVSGLLDDFPSDLADELVKGESLQLDDGSVDEENEDWEKWMPDPVDADPAKSNQRRMSDIISMLVNVYGSQDLFVNEYRTLLADRLLSQLNYHTDREIRHLELLKRRFGENQLHYCEVMLKDIYDSKRIDGLIQTNPTYNTGEESSSGSGFSTSALILSAQFWPPFKEEWKLELPKFVQNQLDKYVKTFETLKGNRTLCWKPHLGNVNLEIQLRDRKVDISVTPIHATIIIHFQEKNQWNVEELAEVMHVPPTILRRKISFWVSQGLLKEIENDVFLLQEDSNTKNRSVAEQCVEEEEVESVMASASDQREEELQVFWSYIVGMLTNLDSMPLERIHQMLKMFASQGPGAVECGLPELRHFLDKKVREHQLLFSGGLYRLPKL